MGLFRYCKCGHEEESHAMDAPEGEQECLEEGCECKNFEWEREQQEITPDDVGRVEDIL